MKTTTIYVMIVLVIMAFLFPASALGDTTLAAGGGHLVQIDKDMNVWAWGINDWGQLALGHNTNQPTPQIVTIAPTLSGDPVSVCAGIGHTCVLDSFKNVACAGRDGYGQIGVGDSDSSSNVLVRPTGVSSVAHIACSSTGVLATTAAGALLVWGSDKYGNLGTGTSTATVWEAVVRFLFLYSTIFLFNEVLV
jgi:alpha-tubulin suppressor-like RCC1 family protein